MANEKFASKQAKRPDIACSLLPKFRDTSHNREEKILYNPRAGKCTGASLNPPAEARPPGAQLASLEFTISEEPFACRVIRTCKKPEKTDFPFHANDSNLI